MPLQLSPSIIKWLTSYNLIHSELVDDKEISYNDQLYFQNGYLIGKLLRVILKQHGHTSEGLLRIRKIAHISSNENWAIIKQVIKDLGFEVEIDPQNIPFSLINSLLQFLYQKFAQSFKQKQKPKEIKTNIDPQSFVIDKPIIQSSNLLQFMVLCLHKCLDLGLSQCLGLLISQCKYLKHIIIFGVNGYEYGPVKQFYELILQQMITLNNLICSQNKNVKYLMEGLGIGVVSQNKQICHLACAIFNSIQETQWIDKYGLILLLKSTHNQALDVLLQKINPQFQKIFNEKLATVFPNKSIMFQNYNKIIKYLRQSIYCRQVFQVLPIVYYLKSVFQIFEPDNNQDQTIKNKLSAKQLLVTVAINFWRQIDVNSKNQIFVAFDSIYCTCEQQTYTTIVYLFEILEEMIALQIKTACKFLVIINKYYSKGNPSIKAFIIDNFIYLYKQNYDQFPKAYLLSTYSMSPIVQANDYHLLQLISQNRNLQDQQLELALKICTIYYYQQLHAGCFIVPMANLANNYRPAQWAKQLASQILTKWSSLTIPPYTILPQSSKKIKLRSIGLKKKEMLQFTQLHRYKSILTLLTKIKNKEFILQFCKLLTKTIEKVQKSKIRQMQNTKIWLNRLLALLDTKLFQLKTKVYDAVINQERTSSPQKQSRLRYTSSYLSQLEKEQSQLFVPVNSDEDYQNQFLKQSADLLLPFSEQQLDESSYYFEDNLFENFEKIYIRKTNQQYSQLMEFVNNSYRRSVDVEHFLKSINIYKYVNESIQTIQKIHQRLKLNLQNDQQICSKLIQQIALLTFYFKRNRRISVKCLESFYQLLLQKNNIKRSSNSANNTSKLEAKLSFSFQITPKIVKSNSKITSWVSCFELVSDMLKTAIGINQIEPISCIVNQIARPQVPQNQTVQQQNIIEDQQANQFRQLERIIQNQSQIQKNVTINNYSSTPIKNSKLASPASQKRRIQYTSQKWATVQKKVMNRRKQLQKKIQKNMNSS